MHDSIVVYMTDVNLVSFQDAIEKVVNVIQIRWRDEETSAMCIYMTVGLWQQWYTTLPYDDTLRHAALGEFPEKFLYFLSINIIVGIVWTKLQNDFPTGNSWPVSKGKVHLNIRFYSFCDCVWVCAFAFVFACITLGNLLLFPNS